MQILHVTLYQYKMCFYLKCLKAYSDHLAWHFVENINFWCMVICCIKRLVKEVSFYNFTLQFFLFVTHSNSLSSDFHTTSFTKKLFYLSRHHCLANKVLHLLDSVLIELEASSLPWITCWKCSKTEAACL